MKWHRPTNGGKYKLVATRKQDNDIGLVVLYEGKRREYSWNNVPRLYDEGLRDYLLSMSEGIEDGIYDITLLDKELDG